MIFLFCSFNLFKDSIAILVCNADVIIDGLSCIIVTIRLHSNCADNAATTLSLTSSLNGMLVKYIIYFVLTKVLFFWYFGVDCEQFLTIINHSNKYLIEVSLI